MSAFSHPDALPNRIADTNDPQLGSLGAALKESLRRQTERAAAAPTPPILDVQKRQGAHTIRVTRSKNSLDLFAPEGHMLATGTFASREELVGSISHFTLKHPKTNVIFLD